MAQHQRAIAAWQPVQAGQRGAHLVMLEHANSWRYGDFHFFHDQTFPDAGDGFYYFE
ncbi:MAG: hypothetical protein ABL867_01390 [Rickettsiales bacterium]